MTRLDVITDGYLLATGKSVLPATGTAKRDLLTNLAVKFYRDWQTEPGMEWDSLYDVIGAGTVSVTDIFTLDTDINFISKREGNPVRVLATDGTYIDFELTTPQQLYALRNKHAVAKISDNRIQFSKAFTADDKAFGGTIQVPAIIKLADITEDSSEILIDNPNWLSARIAAQYVYSYKSLRDMYDDLLAQANELMRGMMDANSGADMSYQPDVDYFSHIGLC